MKNINIIKNKVILFEDNLYIVVDVREKDNQILMSKLESNAEIEVFQLDVFELMNFDFEQARLDAIDIMNQTRYFDNQLVREVDNVVD